MVRKSERNKGNTEKVEKPSTSRKSTRSTRRRKKSTSESEPEAEVHDEATNEVPAPAEEVPTVETAEVPEQKENRRGRGRPKRQAPTDDAPAPSEEQTEKKEEWNEDENFWGETSKKAPPETAKVDETSTWKIQSSNGSGGEIQKLKICRQRLTDSAESSSSPAKEVSSPRRKRKERHLEDGADSTGSHTDNEAPSSSVGDAAGAVCDAANANEDVEPAINEEIVVTQDEIVIETQEAEIVEVIQENEAEPSELPQENEADSVASTVAVREESPIADEPSESGGVVETETVVQDVDQSPVQVTENEEIGAIQASLKETEVPSTEILVTSVGDDHGEIIEDQVVVDSEQVVVEGDPEPEPEQSEPGLEQSEPVPEPEPEKPQSVPEPEQSKPVSKRVTESAVSEPSEPPEVESTTPAKKTHKKNLKLAVSHEDAMQQIAMKLNERAARFSKEATEEASRRLVPAKPPKSERVEEEEEEGEISRNTTATKTLELKRLDDDDVEPSNKKRARCRRPISDTAATSPSTPSGVQPASEASVYDVSTVVLKTLLDVVHPLSEEEVQSIFNPKEDDVEPQMHFDDVGSTGDAGEIEEEGELIEEESEDKKRSSDDRHKHSNERKASRDEKKSERRVTKESSKRGSRDRKDSRSSVDEPRPKKKYEREVSKKEIRRSGEKSDHGEAPRNEENHKIVRKISIVSEDAKTFRRSVSPPTKKPSPVLFITNLVRPFTLAQLRELLARTGTIAPNGFVMDKIKSKCFVKYTDVEMAIETRHALHGVKWPTTNPRLLRVEFSSDEAMEAVKRLAEEEDDAAKRQDLVAQGIDKSWLTERDFIKSSRKPKNLVREWDMGKDVGEVVPAQEGLKKGKEEEWGVKAKEKRVDKEDGRRRPISPSQENSEPARKIKRREPDAPAKLLNDLFRKTKATPCIYWLPLTAEQIAVKEEMRRQHMAEHQKRLAEMRKSESSRRDKDKSRDRDRERERARERRRK